MRSPAETARLPGYHQQVLLIDLAAGNATWEALPETVYRSYLGGAGLGTYLLQQYGAPKASALAPDAALVIAFSPLVGSPLTTSAKFAVVSKSPLTGRINDSLASSGFALSGKQAGCDAIVIRGAAEEPSVLVIDDGKVSLEAAGKLWGASCAATEEALMARWGNDFRFAVIGPAGENQVRFATISHDGRHAGRGGSGAVLGSKYIKALAIRGTQRCDWFDPAGLGRYAKTLSARSFGPATAKYRELGTASNLLLFNRLNTLPTRNFQDSSFEAAEQIAPETLSVQRTRTRASCAACTIGCEHIYSLNPTDGGTTGQVRLEYENLFALGPLCGVGDAETILQASSLCDGYGMDTISLGGTIAFAMECVQRGLIDEPWLRFGDESALLQAIELTAQRKRIGADLAEGSRALAAKVGQNSIQFAAQVKGLELPGYEPRKLHSMALGFAVTTRGADHNRSSAYEADFAADTAGEPLGPGSARLAAEAEDRATLMDSLILCKFLRGAIPDFYGEVAEMLHLVTGWELSEAELRQAAHRIITAKKAFNIDCGWTPEEDWLPPRFFEANPAHPPLSEDALRAAIRAYNELRGWDAAGWVARTDFER